MAGRGRGGVAGKTLTLWVVPGQEDADDDAIEASFPAAALVTHVVSKAVDLFPAERIGGATQAGQLLAATVDGRKVGNRAKAADEFGPGGTVCIWRREDFAVWQGGGAAAAPPAPRAPAMPAVQPVLVHPPSTPAPPPPAAAPPPLATAAGGAVQIQCGACMTHTLARLSDAECMCSGCGGVLDISSTPLVDVRPPASTLGCTVPMPDAKRYRASPPAAKGQGGKGGGLPRAAGVLTVPRIADYRSPVPAAAVVAWQHPPPPPPGDWTCAACGFNNRARNTICGGEGRLGCKLARGADPATAPSPEDKKDWACAKCGNSNFWWRTACNTKHCKSDKPGITPPAVTYMMAMAGGDTMELSGRAWGVEVRLTGIPCAAVVGGDGLPPVGELSRANAGESNSVLWCIDDIQQRQCRHGGNQCTFAHIVHVLRPRCVQALRNAWSEWGGEVIASVPPEAGSESGTLLMPKGVLSPKGGGPGPPDEFSPMVVWCNDDCRTAKLAETGVQGGGCQRESRAPGTCKWWHVAEGVAPSVALSGARPPPTVMGPDTGRGPPKVKAQWPVVPYDLSSELEAWQRLDSGAT